VTAPALAISGLQVTYVGPPPIRALDGLSLDVAAGECVGVLGESGSGKSTLAKALLGLASGAAVEGGLRLGGADLGEVDLGGLDEAGWRAVRWRRIALAVQSTSSLNPVLRVGLQLAEPQMVHLGRTRAEADERSAAVLAEVGLDGEALDRYPSELSGGQRRLVLLAMALVCDPSVVVLDEPTAGLDPSIRARVVDTLRRLRDERRVALVILGHDVEAVGAVADRVAVLYRGWLAEVGPARRVLDEPRAPYTWALLNARPTLGSVKDLRGIRGDPPDPTEIAPGCPFVARCTQVVDLCATGRPPLVAPTGEDGERLVACVRGGVVTLLEGRDLRVSYRLSGTGLGHRSTVVAVDGVSLDVREGEVVGVVGPTGAGKSTLAMLLVRLLEPDGGSVRFEGADLLAAKGSALRAARRRVQLLFQDPYEALSPRLTVGAAVREPLDVQGLGLAEWRDERVRTELATVRLPSDAAFLARHTHELSGGQLQRLALARALILEPKLLVADEPVSMLDPSEQAKMLQLLKHLQVERGMAMVFISHDLAVVLRVADRVVVMDAGRIVEEGRGHELLLGARHPVTKGLLAASGRSTSPDGLLLRPTSRPDG
jgi:peptide/nickel transport system ATP-binding protein